MIIVALICIVSTCQFTLTNYSTCTVNFSLITDVSVGSYVNIIHFLGGKANEIDLTIIGPEADLIFHFFISELKDSRGLFYYHVSKHASGSPSKAHELRSSC